MRPPEYLESARLKLRKPQQGDAAFIYSYARDPEVSRYMTWQPHTDISQSQDYLEICIKDWEQGTNFPWFIQQKETETMIGVVGISLSGHRAVIGYVLNKPFWGKGYTTEAVCVVRDWVMDQPKLFRLWAVCDAENHGSRRVLEKAGMEFEGILRRYQVRPNISSEPRDVLCYSLVR